MNIKSLEAFITIAKVQSITQASRVLFLSQSAISAQLSSLENELGYQLVTRKKGKTPLQLTEQGKDFLPIAQKMLELYNESLYLNENENLQLTFAGVDTVNSYLLPPFISSFSQRHKNVSLHILTLNSDEILDMVESRIADIGLIFSPEKREGLIVEPFYSERLFMVMRRHNPSPGNILRIDPSELDFNNEICLWMGDSYLSWRNHWGKGSFDGSIRVYTLGLLLKLLDRDGLWASVPQLIVNDLAEKENFTVYEYTTPPPNRIAYKVKNRELSTRKKDIILLFERELDSFVRTHGYLEQPV